MILYNDNVYTQSMYVGITNDTSPSNFRLTVPLKGKRVMTIMGKKFCGMGMGGCGCLRKDFVTDRQTKPGDRLTEIVECRQFS